MKEFDAQYVTKGEFPIDGTFTDMVLEINKHEPSEEFAKAYLAQAQNFLNNIKAKREELVQQ
jgi:sulfite reductase (ferredoxin)